MERIIPARKAIKGQYSYLRKFVRHSFPGFGLTG